MSKKVFLILPIMALLLAGCGNELSNSSGVTPGEVAGISESSPITETTTSSTEPTNSQTATTGNAIINNNPNPTMPATTIDKNKTYTAILHTEVGDIEVALNAKATPITVNNFVTLAKKAFYNGTIFHRAIKGFMIQGGDPSGDGTGGPGYQFADEPFTGEYTRGTIAMANAGPNTNGSQFFIMHADYPLPKDYVIFGHVTKGLEVVDKIATAPVERGAMGENSQPVTPVKVKSVEIIEK
jgi:cyclophilin family peptidyl-prolyl cis-trans isomerase